MLSLYFVLQLCFLLPFLLFLTACMNYVQVMGGSRTIEMASTPPEPGADGRRWNCADEHSPRGTSDHAAPDPSSKTVPLALHDSAEQAALPSLLYPNEALPRKPSANTFRDAWSIAGVTRPFVNYLTKRFNSSQLLGIQTSMTDQGFTIIQGPPGTGKTTVVIGILNSIHIREYNKYYQTMIKAVLSAKGLQVRRLQGDAKISGWIALLSTLSRLKPYILVTAPANIAVDNIVERIMAEGFRDGNVGKYYPKILRVGGGKTAKVQVCACMQ